jgi:acid phosphatase
MENKEYTSIIGNTTAAPYINGTLVPSGRLFTQYYATNHPSLPDYLVMTSGAHGACVTDGCPRRSDPDENIFHQMNGASIGWKVYAESMPSNCYLYNSGAYLVRHNPPPYFINLSPSGDNSCATRDVPYTALASDIAGGRLSPFAMIVPNQYNDMHTDQQSPGCLLGSAVQNQICQGDRWLKNNLPPLLSNNGADDVTALIVFDEGSTSRGGGGRVVLLEVGVGACGGCTDGTPSNHYGLEASIAQWFGLPRLSPPALSLP